MTLYEKINNYLENEDRSFSEGLDLFMKASHHRSMMLYLQRKHNAEKLEYELKKLLTMIPQRLKKIILPDNIPANENNSDRTDVQSKNSNALDTKGADTGESKNTEGAGSTGEKSAGDSASGSSDDKKAEDQEVHKVIEFKKVNPEDLPADLKIVYDKIAEAHKEMRSIHEKMKLAESDESRAELRNKLVALDDFITSGWKEIDEFLLLQQQPAKEEVKPSVESSGGAEIAKVITAARSYISRGIADYKSAEEKKKPALKKKMIERVNVLIENKASVSSKTKAALVELKVIPQNSKLLVE